MDQLRAAIHEPGFLSAIVLGLEGNLVVVGFIRLAEVGGVSEDAGAVLLHPKERGAGVETARECDANFLAFGKVMQDCDRLRE